MSLAIKAEDISVPKAPTLVEASSPTLGSIFDKALHDVKDVMTATAIKTNGKVSEIMETFYAISNLKGSYPIPLLNTPLDKASTEIQGNVAKVKDLVKTITTGQPSELITVASKIGELEYLNPAGKGAPALTNVSPQFIAVGGANTKATVVFSGTFPYGKEANSATLTVNGKAFYPIAGSNQEKLKFEVEIASDTPTLSKWQYTFLNASLKVSHSRIGIWPFTKTEEANFETLLGMRPTSPGSFKAIITTPAKINRRTQTTPPIPADSQERIAYYKAQAGWKIVPDSQKLVWATPPEPADYIKARVVQENQIECIFIDKPGASIKIEYEETQEVPEQERSEYGDELLWGEKLTFNPKEGEIIDKVVFKDFDGNETTLKPGDNHSYARVNHVSGSNSIQIIATPPEILNVPVAPAKPAPAAYASESDYKGRESTTT